MLIIRKIHLAQNSSDSFINCSKRETKFVKNVNSKICPAFRGNM